MMWSLFGYLAVILPATDFIQVEILVVNPCLKTCDLGKLKASQYPHDTVNTKNISTQNYKKNRYRLPT